ncbi:MAG: hypothetical protein A2945_01270 [Candidatus Liptonbacteria bacterium RIFCSPLOWO2_01_FULL_52_25]|uniref:Uncharacterized protein n=1 Tax=Candidatus Liptonbacteria bacterium RIFCSPLOWO2_01_FULL_52_25 TaxID=1798650 RepID=A0A1G2CFP2_9BACT|nr:MAG: hypothetical protein A2945_01270 [Candidatus Liptonbacteria bacterium RIFCSPLOWO2_01_FULL_52_25]
MKFNVAFFLAAIAYAYIDFKLILHYLPRSAEEQLREVGMRIHVSMIFWSSVLLLALLSLPGFVVTFFFGHQVSDNPDSILGAASVEAMLLLWCAGLIVATALSTHFPEFTLRWCAKRNTK